MAKSGRQYGYNSQNDKNAHTRALNVTFHMIINQTK